MDAKEKQDIADLIRTARYEKLKEIQKARPIDPSDWSAVDDLMSDLLEVLTASYTAQLTVLMRLLADNEVQTDLATHVHLTLSNVDAVLVTTILQAHFIVSKEHGRQVNDAHLHLDRIARCADSETGLYAEVIRKEG